MLVSFKKALEINGKPEVYAPLAALADSLQRWMRVRPRGLPAAGAAAGLPPAALKAWAANRHTACATLQPSPRLCPEQEREQVAAAAMRQQAQGGQGRGGYQAARFQEPYEKLVPAKEVGAVAGDGGALCEGGGSPALPARPPLHVPCCSLLPRSAPRLRQMLRELSAMGLGAEQVDPLWEAYTAAREEEEAMAAEGGPGPPREGKENKVGGG